MTNILQVVFFNGPSIAKSSSKSTKIWNPSRQSPSHDLWIMLGESAVAPFQPRCYCWSAALRKTNVRQCPYNAKSKWCHHAYISRQKKENQEKTCAKCRLSCFRKYSAPRRACVAVAIIYINQDCIPCVTLNYLPIVYLHIFDLVMRSKFCLSSLHSIWNIVNSMWFD